MASCCKGGDKPAGLLKSSDNDCSMQLITTATLFCVVKL
jgi:hypothetical protein